MSILEKILLYLSTVVSIAVAIAMFLVWSSMSNVKGHLTELNEWRYAFSHDWRIWAELEIEGLRALHNGEIDPPPVPDPPPEYEG